MKNFLKNESGNLEMVKSGVFLVVLITILYIGLTINSNVIEATDLDPAVAATGTLTFTGVGSADEVVNVSSETYTMKAAAAGAYQVTIGATADASMDNLVAEITANSTQVTATNVLGVGTVTAITPGVVGNAYDFNTDVTGGTAGAATLTGGVAADALYTASQDMDTTTESAYGMAGIMPVVMIAVAILASLLGIVYLFR